MGLSESSSSKIPGCTSRYPIDWRANPIKLRAAFRTLRGDLATQMKQVHLTMRDLEKIAAWLDRKALAPTALVEDFVQTSITRDPYSFVRTTDLHRAWRQWYALRPRQYRRIPRNTLYQMLDEAFGTRTYYQGFQGWRGIHVQDVAGRRTKRPMEINGNSEILAREDPTQAALEEAREPRSRGPRTSEFLND